MGEKETSSKIEKIKKEKTQKEAQYKEKKKKEAQYKEARIKSEKRSKENRAKELKGKEKKNKEKKGKERAGKEKKEKVNECKPASVKGEEFYSWDGKYCYHIVAVSVLEQGRWNGQGRKSLCNKRGFKKSVVIGRGRGITSNYKNGDSKACPGGRKRSASLRIVRSKGLKSSFARVSEPRTCHYAIVITVPDCKPSVEKNTKEKIPKEKKGKERKGKEVKDKERGNKER